MKDDPNYQLLLPPPEEILKLADTAAGAVVSELNECLLKLAEANSDGLDEKCETVCDDVIEKFELPRQDVSKVDPKVQEEKHSNKPEVYDDFFHIVRLCNPIKRNEAVSALAVALAVSMRITAQHIKKSNTVTHLEIGLLNQAFGTLAQILRELNTTPE